MTQYRQREAHTTAHFSTQVLSPTIQQLLANRGVYNDTDLTLTLNQLAPASDLLGLTRAVHIIDDAIDSNQSIVIVGDFDADGATSTALMLLALKDMGASNIAFLVPDRFKFGYGLTPEIVQLAIDSYQPNLIITVDNGISSTEGVIKAQQQGITVIITDHHLTSKPAPPAQAVVNPNQLNCAFSSKALAGVGVAFYVLASLNTHRKKLNKPHGNVAQYLDLVALGTVADVAQLDKNNRILVHAGLQRIRTGRCRLGILALLDIAAKDKSKITAQDLGFVLGPRINAAGRMEHMKIGIQCLIADDYPAALALAKQLDDLNQQRRSTETDIKEQALTLLADLPLASLTNKGSTTNNTPHSSSNITTTRSIVLYQPDWHQGVIGIVAGRLKDQYYCPAIVFAPSDDTGTLIKGSARSIEQIHIRDAIEQIAEQHPELISHFGGHAMAAGLSIKVEHFNAFAQAFDALMLSYPPHVFNQVVLTDGALQPNEIQLSTVQQIAQLEPWGMGFPSPIFEGAFKVLRKQILKDKHLKLTLQHPQTHDWLSAIQFNTPADVNSIDEGSIVHLVYTLQANQYNGKTSLQLQIIDIHCPSSIG